jgi:hypothetical protein
MWSDPNSTVFCILQTKEVADGLQTEMISVIIITRVAIYISGLDNTECFSRCSDVSNRKFDIL